MPQALKRASLVMLRAASIAESLLQGEQGGCPELRLLPHLAPYTRGLKVTSELSLRVPSAALVGCSGSKE